MEMLAIKFVNILINNNIIKKEDAEIYSYGFKEMIFITLNVLTTIFIGLIFNKMFLYVCVFKFLYDGIGSGTYIFNMLFSNQNIV